MVGYMFRTEKAHLPVHYNNYGSGYRFLMPTLCYVLHYIYIIYTRELKCQPCKIYPPLDFKETCTTMSILNMTLIYPIFSLKQILFFLYNFCQKWLDTLYYLIPIQIAFFQDFLDRLETQSNKQ